MDMVQMIRELRRDEGVEYVEYQDSRGFPTTGVGHNLKVSPIDAGWDFPLTDEQVNLLLMQDLKNAIADLDKHLPWWRSLDEVRQRVVLNMCFNMGVGTLCTFHVTLIRMKSGDYLGAAAEMENSDWYAEVKDRAVRLCAAMKTGVMPG